jgi:hypothetical protein
MAYLASMGAFAQARPSLTEAYWQLFVAFGNINITTSDIDSNKSVDQTDHE